MNTSQKQDKDMNKRVSIRPTYDSRKDGLQYQINTAVNGQYLSLKEIADPFVNHTVKLSLIDTIKGLMQGGVEVSIMISGKNRRIEEDVMELDDNYLPLGGSTRRDKFNNDVFKHIKKLGE